MIFILTGLVLAYLAFLLWHAGKLPAAPVLKHIHDYPSVCVVIPARNESGTIQQCLDALLLQDYPADRLQVIIVDDHSTDNTLALALTWADKHDGHAQVLRLPDDLAGKKAALGMGIAASKADIILTTDADTTAPRGWVWRMMEYMQADAVMVVGSIRKTYKPGSVFGSMQALESAGMLGLTAAAIGAGRPMLCNGANLAFRKAAYLQVGGYQSPQPVASGDDELLMHKIQHAGLGRIAFAAHADAVVSTPALTSWCAFVQQRLRWVSKSRAYRYGYMTASQVLAYLAHLSLLALFGWACWLPSLWPLVAPLCVLKVMADAALTLPALRLNGQAHLAWGIPLAQLWHIPYVVWVGLAGNLTRHYTWKGRRVR